MAFKVFAQRLKNKKKLCNLFWLHKSTLNKDNITNKNTLFFIWSLISNDVKFY